MGGGDEHMSDDLAADVVAQILPFGGTLGRRLWRPVRREWAQLTSAAIKAAERTSGMTREDLAKVIENDPSVVPLWMKILWAAGMNGHDETLHAMGAVFGAAAKASATGDAETFEDAELALTAMADLGPRHFQVLRVLSEGDFNPSQDVNSSRFTPKHVASEAGMRKDVASQCLLNLAAAGLAVSTSLYNGTAYPISDLGRAVVKAAKLVAPDAEE